MTEDDSVREWVDNQALAHLVAELSSAVDRGDEERIVACYADESFDDHGLFKGSGRDFASFVSGPSPLATMHHLLGQSLFDVRGDEAWGETFFVFHGRAVGAGAGSMVPASDGGDAALHTGWGRYVDYFRRIDGRWKVAYRRVVPDAVPAGDDIGAYWPGSRDRNDPSYDRRRRP